MQVHTIMMYKLLWPRILTLIPGRGVQICTPPSRGDDDDQHEQHLTVLQPILMKNSFPRNRIESRLFVMKLDGSEKETWHLNLLLFIWRGIESLITRQDGKKGGKERERKERTVWWVSLVSERHKMRRFYEKSRSSFSDSSVQFL